MHNWWTAARDINTATALCTIYDLALLLLLLKFTFFLPLLLRPFSQTHCFSSTPTQACPQRSAVWSSMLPTDSPTTCAQPLAHIYCISSIPTQACLQIEERRVVEYAARIHRLSFTTSAEPLAHIHCISSIPTQACLQRSAVWSSKGTWVEQFQCFAVHPPWLWV